MGASSRERGWMLEAVVVVVVLSNQKSDNDNHFYFAKEITQNSQKAGCGQ